MLLLGHAGITLGGALAVEMAQRRLKGNVASAGERTRTWREPLERLSRKVDLRLLLIGSLLPDIIDKPTGLLLFPHVFGGGRLFAHTLLFVLVLANVGLIYKRARDDNGILVLAYGSAMHLVLDGMWRSPAILLWPFLGPMPIGTADRWLAHLLENLTQNPLAYVPEMLGAIIVAPLVWALFRRGGLLKFLRTGTMG